MGEQTEGITTEVTSDDADGLLTDLEPGDGAESVTGGAILKNGDPCDGSEFHTR